MFNISLFEIKNYVMPQCVCVCVRVCVCVWVSYDSRKKKETKKQRKKKERKKTERDNSVNRGNRVVFITEK